MNRPESRNGKTRFAELSYSRVWWLLTTALAAALILGLGALESIRLLALPLALLIFALTLAAALDPMVAWLEQRIPRLVAIILTYLVVLLLLVSLIWAVIPSLVDQVQDLGSRIPDLVERAREFLDRWEGGRSEDSFANTIFSQLSSLGPALLRLPLTITSVLSGILLILFISFYILTETSRMQGFLLSLFPARRRDRVNEIITAMGQAMGGYLWSRGRDAMHRLLRAVFPTPLPKPDVRLSAHPAFY